MFTLKIIFLILLIKIKINCITFVVDPEVGLYKLIDSLGGNDKIEPGTIFEYKKANYGTQWRSGLKGNSTHHIIFKGCQGAIIRYFYFTNISYIDFIGPFEVTGSAEHGIYFTGSNFITVKNFHIHHVIRNCIFTGGQNIIVKDNYLHDCVYMNYQNNGTSWGQCLGVGGRNSQTKDYLSHNITVENNTIYDSWGEGIDLLCCNNCTAKNNTIRNAFSVLLYADNSKNLIIENNFMYVTSDRFNVSGHRPTAIAIGTENTQLNINSTDIIIRNNLAIGVHNAIQRFTFAKNITYFARMKITHNTFFNLYGLGMQFDCSDNEDLIKDNEVSNNLFSGNYNKLSITKIAQSFKVFANGWVWKNIWYTLKDTEGNTSFVIRDNMENVLFPSTKEIKGGCYKIECYLPRCLNSIEENDTYGNLLIQKGIKSQFSGDVDFFGRKRSLQKPTIGFSELCVLPDSWIIQDKNTLSTGLIILIVILVIVFIVIGGFLFVKFCLKKIHPESSEKILSLINFN